MKEENKLVFIRRAREVWSNLENISINNEGEIEEEFMHFSIGTDREYIWHWIEDTYNISVATDLMNII